MNDKYGKPYKNSKYSYLKYLFESFVAMNPRLYSLWLLYCNMWPRILVFIAELYISNQTGLFAISCLIIVFPFFSVWMVSLRFIQMYLNEIQNESQNQNNNNNNNKNNNNDQSHKNKIKRSVLDGLFPSWADCGVVGKLCNCINLRNPRVLNVLLWFYLFPPIGCLLVTIFELFWVLNDVYVGLYSFSTGKILLIDKNQTITSIKQFRKVIETLAQTLIQIYMFAAGTDVNDVNLGISLGVSLFNLIYNCNKLRKEAKFQEMSFASYVISVLQLGKCFFCFFFFQSATILRRIYNLYVSIPSIWMIKLVELYLC